MNWTEEQLNEKFNLLDKPFPAEDIEWMIKTNPTNESNGKGRALVLAHLTNRAVQQRLDDVFGKLNWRNEFAPGPNGGMMCGLSLRINGEWITKWDGADNTAVEAVKGGFSSAMKRAAVQWGVGRYLYYLGNTWANVEKRGKGWYIPDGQEPKLPKWALPEGYKPRILEGATAPVVEESSTASVTSEVKVETVTQAESEPTTKGNGKAQGKPVPATQSAVTEKARAYVIPEGLPSAGKTLGQALDENNKLGVHILKILAGRVEGMKVKAYVPKNDDEKKAVAAAGYLLDQMAAEPVAN